MKESSNSERVDSITHTWNRVPGVGDTIKTYGIVNDTICTTKKLIIF